MHKVFFVYPCGATNLYLRRYRESSNDREPCKGNPLGYCTEMVLFQRVTEERDEEGYPKGHFELKPPNDDPRWPTVCSYCKTPFTERDPFQLFQQTIYTDGKQEWEKSDLPPGACYDAFWYPRKGQDGRSLVIVLPNKWEWFIDGRASNCTKRDDDIHRCWVRHGRPEDGNLHVDKNGNTCAAGAGSIQAGDFHGFLKEGFLT